jgi:hypothetical protein
MLPVNSVSVDKFGRGGMPELVRYPLLTTRAGGIANVGKLTRRERKLYVALAVILSLNLTVLCGALTFFGLMFVS